MIRSPTSSNSTNITRNQTLVLHSPLNKHIYTKQIEKDNQKALSLKQALTDTLTQFTDVLTANNSVSANQSNNLNLSESSLKFPQDAIKANSPIGNDTNLNRNLDEMGKSNFNRNSLNIGNKIQTGLDRYISVTKRKRSPQKNNSINSAKMQKQETLTSENKFAILSLEDNTEKSKPKSTKPPPLYLREKCSNNLVNWLASLIGAKNFHVVNIRKGAIMETKVQIYHENEYRKVTKEFDLLKKSYYTFQLKSAKGLCVVLKGIDHDVNPKEIKEALENEGFQAKNVHNIINKDKVPQPMFRIELEPRIFNLKKGQVHPIYNLNYLLSRKITVEEPYKRKGPPQCTNCQEFGHTKTYCNLPSVCVICGDLHQTVNCKKPKEQKCILKCGNCGGNHTANYRGCPVFENLKSKPVSSIRQNMNTRNQFSEAILTDQSFPPLPKTKAQALATNSNKETKDNSPQQGMEKILETLVQNMNQFMTTMQNMMQELMRNQSLMLQALLSK